MFKSFKEATYKFNYFTYQSVEQCKTALENYATGDIALQTKLASQTYSITEKDTKYVFVTIHEKPIGFQFRVHQYGRGVFREFETIATVQPEGDGARVIGYTRAFDFQSSQVALGVMVIIAIIVATSLQIPFLDIPKSQANLVIGIVAVLLLSTLVITPSIGFTIITFFKADKIRKVLGGLISGEQPRPVGRG